ncbi:hypothetical protein ACQP00_01715 [Dactylosporangium sp. CS-047395]|uniref:hypothetical protein n=1 Tax=Dactylosporangium sp. CS-047395 TaxID=3239936 RepID=UPI003D8BDBB9
MKGFGKYWGYIALILLLTAWWTTKIGPGVLIVLSVAVTLYFLFQAPIWCGAITRDETLCRRNASGLLLGCSYRQHKWQKLKMAVVPPMWRRLNQGLWTSPATGLATIGTILGLVSGFAGLVKSMLE